MNFLRTVTVRSKLFLLNAIAFLSLILFGYISYVFLHQSNDMTNYIYDDCLVPIALVNENRSYINRMNAAILELMLTTDDKKNSELKNLIDQRTRQLNDNFGLIESKPHDTQSQELLNKAKISLQSYLASSQQTLALALQNKNEEAYQLYVKTVEKQAQASIDDMRQVSEYYNKVSLQTKQKSTDSFNTSNRITIFLVMLLGSIFLISGYYISKQIVNPLKSMVSFCEELAAGDFTDKPRRIMNQDEFGQVSNALLNMRMNLRSILKQIHESSEQVAASSQQLYASAEQSALASTQVASSINDVAKSAEQQLQAALKTSNIVDNLAGNILEATDTAYTVSTQSENASNQANEGNHSVEKAITQMNNIEKTVFASAEVVQKLGERSKEIGQIVDTISGIAGQTNLLALNAAIEAARAGEQGRGFAVVAEEVRKLAEQSQDAAKQIAELITEIQNETDKAVNSMNSGTKEVKLGTEVVTLAGKTFKNIAELIIGVSNQMKSISTTMDQMSTNSEEIVFSAKTIDDLSRKTAEQSETVSAATEEQSATMEEVASASQALARLAEGMRNAVLKFKI
ncbi:MAG: methyl-accepting chemotaxis protein [Sporomusaceae bacterium]|nr:methyl-accepting chemotaxis protein [Sporomusaceae bacterium]